MGLGVGFDGYMQPTLGTNPFKEPSGRHRVLDCLFGAACDGLGERLALGVRLRLRLRLGST